MASRGGLSGLALAEIAAGVILAWSGIENASLVSSLRSLIGGKKPAPDTGNEPVTGTAATNPVSAAAGSISSAVSAAATAGNRAVGYLMASAYGWGGSEWPYLESGWNAESGWSQTAANDPGDPYNHAYGIPQANPGTKMASAGADWKTNPATQIRWGLAYIKATYGSPSRVPGWTPSGPAAGYQGY